MFKKKAVSKRRDPPARWYGVISEKDISAIKLQKPERSHGKSIGCFYWVPRGILRKWCAATWDAYPPVDWGESNYTRTRLIYMVARVNACTPAESSRVAHVSCRVKHFDATRSMIGRRGSYCALGNKPNRGNTRHCTMPLIVNTETYIASVWVKLAQEMG